MSYMTLINAFFRGSLRLWVEVEEYSGRLQSSRQSALGFTDEVIHVEEVPGFSDLDDFDRRGGIVVDFCRMLILSHQRTAGYFHSVSNNAGLMNRFSIHL